MSDKGTILVTGGAGYIGSHTCKALARAGYRPVVIDNLVHGHPWAVKWGPLFQADIQDADALDAVFAEHRPEAVIHFAAFCYVGESVQDPAGYWDNNVAGTLSLLQAMRRHGCGRIVFSSTCATYGVPRTLPLTEDHVQVPVNPYGWSKLAVERMLKDFETAYGMRHAILRYFNAAGADPEGELGEEHDPETHLIPLALRAAARATPLTVFGNDYDTPDGTCIRDYVHVLDLAQAHILSLDHLAAGRSLECNLGTGRGYSVLQVAGTCSRVTGREASLEFGDRRPGDPPQLVADATRARELLSWRPEYPDLETIVGHAWNWMREREGGRKEDV